MPGRPGQILSASSVYGEVMADAGETDPTRRALQILGILQARSSASAAELAARLRVTERTVRRDMQRLRDLGYRVDGEAGQGGGYRLAGGSDRPLLVLEADEASAVVLGLSHLTDLGLSGLEDPALSALAKVARTMSPTLSARAERLRRGTAVVGERAQTADVEQVARLAEAAAEGRIITVTHRRRDGATTDRRIDPHRVVAFAGRWYLFGWCHLRRDWRTFRIDRLADLHVTTLRQQVRVAPDAAGAVRRAVLHSPYPQLARVLVDAPAEEVRARIPARAADVEPADDSARTLITAGAHDLTGLALHLAMLELPLEVIEPVELVETLHRLGETLCSAAAVSAAGRSGTARAE